ncbi:MAG: hypothetical protein F2839_05650 [Actinobacteria bacterium]|uniref:Unannotated protein n=1 Tax=freshwater metagenome TaxID=449393 RepID=A0A6J5ZMV5_9ZZZZ|nr:hypothetical protein [Actinomycetota bacterium]
MTTTIARTPLTASDRCDRCGAKARVRVYLDGGSELLFCSHHFREHEVRLRQIALDVLDESESSAQLEVSEH